MDPLTDSIQAGETDPPSRGTEYLTVRPIPLTPRPMLARKSGPCSALVSTTGGGGKRSHANHLSRSPGWDILL